MEVPNKRASNFTIIISFFENIDKLSFQLVQSKVVKLLLNLCEDSFPFFRQLINDRVKEFFDVLLNRLKRVRIGKDVFLKIGDGELEAVLMWRVAVTVLIFANEGFLSAVLTETSD
jgi:hypothetical protein